MNTEQLLQYIDATLEFSEGTELCVRAKELVTLLDKAGYVHHSDALLRAWEDVHPETLQGIEVIEQTLFNTLGDIS